MFFVLITSNKDSLHDAAITVASMTELSLYCITSVAVLIGMCQVRRLWYDNSRKLELDNLLLVVAQTGVFIYSAFCIIGSFFEMQNHLLAFLASLATLVSSFYRPGQPNWEYTILKSQDFSAPQILREINFGHFESQKTAILTI